jgi:drug/metabolite transporter (DMT)-like permease
VLTATVLALAAAALHAGWNLVIKVSAARDLATWGQFLAGGLLFAPLLLFTGLPEGRAWPFLVASAIVHVAYVYGLISAYHHGDFSLVYPLARGGGALVAALVAAIALGDNLGAGEWAALAIVAAGLASLVRPGAPRTELAFAGATAVVIGTYTVIDAAGARRTTNGFAYAVTLTVLSAVALSVVGVARGRLPAFAASVRPMWWRYVFSGLCLTAAYGLVLAAVRFAPVGYVATLRESSVVIGAAIGWLWLHESLGRRRLVSSCVVTAGLVALIAFGS